MSNDILKQIEDRLQAPFPEKDIEWRVHHTGKSNGRQWAMVLAYVDNRAIQNRLDEVFGPGGWKNEFHDFRGGVLCTISCKVGDEWISKTDGAEPTQFESFKGGLSSAMKRAGVQWGIGRYLYDLPQTFVEVYPQKPDHPDAKFIRDDKTGVRGYWIPPKLPDWALPENERNGNRQFSGQKKSVQSAKEEQNHSQKESQPQDSRAKMIKMIYNVARASGLLQKEEWGLRLLKSVNPNVKGETFQEALKFANDQELKTYEELFEPVNMLYHTAKFYNVRVQDLLYYVQILHPQDPIKNVLQCFGILRKEDIKRIIAMLKDDLKGGSLAKQQQQNHIA